MSRYVISNSATTISKTAALSLVPNLTQILDQSKEITEPLIFRSDFKDSYEGVVYHNSKTTIPGQYINDNFRNMWKVDLDDYLPDYQSFIWKNFDPKRTNDLEYAFGIFINNFHTKLFVLDFDNTHIDNIYKIASIFLDDYVEGIDVIRSSIKNGSSSYHLIVGFKDFRNVCSLYEKSFPCVCPGFISFARKLHEVVIRVSDKKIIRNGVHSTDENTPNYMKCIRNINDKRWVVYSTGSIRKKSSKSNHQELHDYFSKELVKTPVVKLDLRRKKRGNNNSKQKSKRKKTSTISSIKDIINLS